MIGIFDSHISVSANISDTSLVLKSKVGDHCQLFEDSMLCYSELGNFSYLSRRTSVFSSIIKKYCSISWNVSIGPANHDYHRITSHSMLFATRFGMIDDNAQRYYNQYDKETIIENDVWIGCNAVILRGVHIGNGAVIGANSVITKDVPPYTIMGGVNRVLKKRFSDDIIERLLELQWWNYPIDVVKTCIPLIASEPSIEILDELKSSLQ